MEYLSLKPYAAGPEVTPPGEHPPVAGPLPVAERCHLPIHTVSYPGLVPPPWIGSCCARTLPIVGNPVPAPNGGDGGPVYSRSPGSHQFSRVLKMQVCCEYSPVSRVAREGVQAVAATK